MRWRVMSKRMAWPAGTLLGSEQLAGCNIGALVQGGHLAPVEELQTLPEIKAVPKLRSKVEPANPAAEQETAEGPEEQD